MRLMGAGFGELGSDSPIPEMLAIRSGSSGATGAILELFQDSTSIAIGDVVGDVRFYGRDADGAKIQYAGLGAQLVSVADELEISRLRFLLQEVPASGLTEILRLETSSGAAIFNNAKAAGATPAMRFSAVANYGAGQPIVFFENNNGAILAMRLDGDGDLNVAKSYEVAGTKVVGTQGAAVADATDAASTMARLNDLLARCRAHGLIAT